MQVEIWSDVVCPWCYIGKRRFERALARFPHHDDVAVTWHSFELDPSAPEVRDGTYAERLSQKYAVPVASAEDMIRQMTSSAAAEGVAMRFDRARPGNTFAAHRLLHLARNRGLQDELKERLLAAYLTEGEPIGTAAALVRQATTVGLDPVEVRAVLDSDAYADDVRADERQAAAYGITGVPFFVVDHRYGVSGAQPADLLLQVLDRAWGDQRPTVLAGVRGAASDVGCGGEHQHVDRAGCEGDSCAV